MPSCVRVAAGAAGDTMTAPADTAALVVGIDAYAAKPLTSAVHDATAFRDALVRLELVRDTNVVFLPNPGHQAILDALQESYAGGSKIKRFYFFFSGHGCLGYVDAARSRTHSAIIPVNFRDFARDAGLLIDVDDLAERMQLAGPLEQFHFIDACRDMPYDSVPNLPPIAWPAAKAGAARKQARVFAVSPLGTAAGVRDGMGVMTSHLLKGLEGAGIALDYSDDLEEFVITAQSLCNYAEEQVRTTLSGTELWQHKYMVPEIRVAGPATDPIRRFAVTKNVGVTLHIDPDAAAGDTTVTLSHRRNVVFTWPPKHNHEQVALLPQRYLIEASSRTGAVEPARAPLDVRQTQEATIRVTTVVPPPVVIADSGVSATVAVVSRPKSDHPTVGHKLGVSTALGTVIAKAMEKQVAIELKGLDPPYLVRSHQHTLEENVPPGFYRVSFRIGPDVFSTTEFEVATGETVRVTPTAGTSPILRDSSLSINSGEAALVSETIGAIQAAVVPTMLPMIGLKLFDVTGTLFSRLQSAVPTIEPSQFGPSPLALVIAIDGHGWARPAPDVLTDVRVALDGGAAVGLQPLQAPGFERVGFAAAAAPGRSFKITLSSPDLGSVVLASAALRRRATIVTLRFTPDGQLDVSQNLLRLPGQTYDDEPDPNVPPGRLIRQLQLGQKLYQSGELVASAETTDLELINMMFYAKWTDPILSCMAFFALDDAAKVNQAARERWAHWVPQVATNLRKYFADLPDSRVVFGLSFTAERDALFEELLQKGEVPVLARSAKALVTYRRGLTGAAATKLGPSAAALEQFVDRIGVKSAWSVTWEVPKKG